MRVTRAGGLRAAAFAAATAGGLARLAAACSPFSAGDDGAATDAAASADGPGSGGPDGAADAGATDGANVPPGDASDCFPEAVVCERFPTSSLRDIGEGWTVDPDGVAIERVACKEGSFCLSTKAATGRLSAGVRHRVVFDDGKPVVVELWARRRRGDNLDVVEIGGGGSSAYLGLVGGRFTLGLTWGDDQNATTSLTLGAEDAWHRYRLEIRAPAIVSASVDGVPIPMPELPAGASFGFRDDATGELRAGVYSTTDGDAVDVDLVGLVFDP